MLLAIACGMIATGAPLGAILITTRRELHSACLERDTQTASENAYQIAMQERDQALRSVTSLQNENASQQAAAIFLQASLDKATRERDAAAIDRSALIDRVAYLERIARREVPNPYLSQATAQELTAPLLEFHGDAADVQTAADEAVARHGTRIALLISYRAKGYIGDSTISKDVARLVVKPAFYTLDFDEKRTIAQIAWQVAFAGPGTRVDQGIVRLIDSKSGKTAGVYSTLGLTME